MGLITNQDNEVMIEILSRIIRAYNGYYGFKKVLNSRELSLKNLK